MKGTHWANCKTHVRSYLDCLQVLFCAFQVQFTKFTSQNNSEQTQQPHTTSSPSIITSLKTRTVLLNHPLHHQRGLIIITIHQSIKTLQQSVRFKPRETSYPSLSLLVRLPPFPPPITKANFGFYFPSWTQFLRRNPSRKSLSCLMLH